MSCVLRDEQARTKKSKFDYLYPPTSHLPLSSITFLHQLLSPPLVAAPQPPPPPCPHPPPLKNSLSTNSSAPSCSTPTATMLTPCVSNVGLRRLIFTAPSRHNCHPNRRMNMITAGLSDQKLSMGTDCRHMWKMYCVCGEWMGGGEESCNLHFS